MCVHVFPCCAIARKTICTNSARTDVYARIDVLPFLTISKTPVQPHTQQQYTAVQRQRARFKLLLPLRQRDNRGTLVGIAQRATILSRPKKQNAHIQHQTISSLVYILQKQ